MKKTQKDNHKQVEKIDDCNCFGLGVIFVIVLIGLYFMGSSIYESYSEPSKNDIVYILSGNDAGCIGRVLETYASEGAKILLEKCGDSKNNNEYTYISFDKLKVIKTK